MKKILRTFIALSVAGCLLIPQAFAYWDLSVPSERQQNSNWCWAASSVSIARYYSKAYLYYDYGILSTTQSNHVFAALGYVSNDGREAYEIRTDFSNLYNLSSTVAGGRITRSAINTELQAGRPFIVGIQFVGLINISHHVVTICGIAPAATYETLKEIEPWTGVTAWRPYSMYTGNFTYTSPYSSDPGNWCETIYQIQ